MRAFLASAVSITCAALVGLLVYLGVTLVSVESVGKRTATATADVIVVMGAAQYDGTPSPMLEARLAHALQLFNAHRAPLIAVTGGKQQADRFTEAATSRRWLTDHGVPADKILLESTGRSTWESLNNLASTLHDHNLHSVIVSTSQWHVQRSVLTLRELGFRVQGSGAPATATDTMRLGKETIGVAIGRIIGFHQLFRITG